jgi:phospholipid-binding lipoprotein MlaA
MSGSLVVLPGDISSISNWLWLRRILICLAALVLVAGCASQPDTAPGGPSSEESELFEEDIDDNDPLETINRFTFAFNLTLDVFIFKPAAATYRFLLPQVVRDSVRNVLRNVRTPVVLANDLFQGEMERAEHTAMRFLINSTIGVLGLFDVAEDMGYPYHDEDFGQTMAVHGAGEGAYLVLPLFGPSSIRDGIGLGVDTLLDPLTYILPIYDAEEVGIARTAVNGIDTRSRFIDTLDDLQRDAIDFYARIRSLYRQTRQNDIRNGEPQEIPTPGLYSFDFNIDDEKLEDSQ